MTTVELRVRTARCPLDNIERMLLGCPGCESHHIKQILTFKNIDLNNP